MSLVVFVALAAGAAVYYGKVKFDEAGPLDRSVNVRIPKGFGLNQIAARLQDNGIITNSLIFRTGVRAFMPDDTLKAGEYEIKANASMRDVMELLRSGISVQYSVTIPEGFTVQQIFDRLAASEDLTGDLPEQLPPEGSLMPNTYKFTRGTARADVVDQMRVAQASVRRGS
ncbi:MAG: endolytic transglycosylase MltG, partial [Pseudomonadota bacterium]